MLYGIISLTAGLVLLLVAELAGVAALRIFAAMLLVGGAAGAGVAAGFSSQSQGLLKRIAALFPRVAVCALAIVVMAPVLTVITASLLSATTRFINPDAGTNIFLTIAGGIIALLLLTALLIVMVIGINAIRGKKLPQAVKEPA